jgi:hypothetical protein
MYVYLYRCGSVREWYGAFPDWGPLAEDSATKLKGGQLNVCTVYGVLFSLLWLKFVPGWPAISISSCQENSLGHMIWFGRMSDISPLASRVGGEGDWGAQVPLSLHYLAQGEGQGEGGLRSLPLVLSSC